MSFLDVNIWSFYMFLWYKLHKLLKVGQISDIQMFYKYTWWLAAVLKFTMNNINFLEDF